MQAYLPTMVRARVEATFPEANSPWDTILLLSRKTPTLHRFIREHPSAPTYYDWLIRHAVKTFPTWGELASGV